MTAFRFSILLLISVFGLPSVKAAETIYFLVGDLPGRPVRIESFVLPLSGQEDINCARYLISQARSGFAEGDRTIVVATVRGATHGINRNFLDPKFPEWTWEVREFLQFAELVAEGIIFSPTALEGNWGPADSMTVGFEGLFVIRELGPHPLSLSIVPEGEELHFYWSGLGTNAVYTLEAKDTLTGTDWSPVSGASWPLETNQWVLPQTETVLRYYRVKAEHSED